MTDSPLETELEPVSQAKGSTQKTEGTSTRADLLLVHSGLDSETIQGLLRSYWPDGDLSKIPEGYVEISSVFPGLRAFVCAGSEHQFSCMDSSLTGRVREWVDIATRRWNFAEVFKARELNYWAFLRDRLIHWLCDMLNQRRVLMQIAGEGSLLIVAAGVDSYQRILLRQLTELLQRRVRIETAYVKTPAMPEQETITERRVRKIFFMVQDAWHSVKLLVGDLLLRRPKVLLMSDSQCWKRRRGKDNKWLRTDLHLEAVWRQGRKRSFRMFYRSDSYHPDVGSMTQGSLAPTYLQHFLFLLDQTSRGIWETRRINRKWAKLKENPEFETGLIFEDFPIGELVISWLDTAVNENLSDYVRDTRRENHFLRGIRPAAILMTHEQETNRPVMLAARKLGIPIVAMQLTPYQKWDATYLSPLSDSATKNRRPDRFCVFSADAKAQLVEQGIFDPPSVVVTGDPRLDVLDFDKPLEAGARAKMFRHFGVEEGQKVVAVACSLVERVALFEWLGRLVRGRKDLFVLVRLESDLPGEVESYQQAASTNELSWFHLVPQARFDEALCCADTLIASSLREIAEGLLWRIPVVQAQIENCQRSQGTIPADLVQTVHSADELISALADESHRDFIRTSDYEAVRKSFLETVYGSIAGGGASAILDTVERLLGRDAD